MLSNATNQPKSDLPDRCCIKQLLCLDGKNAPKSAPKMNFLIYAKGIIFF